MAGGRPYLVSLTTILRPITEWLTTSDGVRVAYHQVGAGDPAIIFIHGAYSNRRGFGFQEEYFSPDHRCVAVDLRGHGESDKPDQLYTMDQHRHDVAELIRHSGLEKPVLVGQSMGGQVIIAAAAHHPELVGAIASLDSPSNLPGWHQRFHGPYDHLMTRDGPFPRDPRRFPQRRPTYPLTIRPGWGKWRNAWQKSRTM